jgi:hypothetical protein
VIEQPLEIMRFLAKAYVGAGYPNHRVWTFSTQQERDPVYSELVARGLLKRFGAGTTHFTLTQAGVDWILQQTHAETAST